mgnify:CR=1 FL=1
MVHTNLRNLPKRLGQHARTFARGVGTAVDKTVAMANHHARGMGSAVDSGIGTAHHYLKDLDPVMAGRIGGALGQDQDAITKIVSRTKRNVASYEELRKATVGARV